MHSRSRGWASSGSGRSPPALGSPSPGMWSVSSSGSLCWRPFCGFCGRAWGSWPTAGRRCGPKKGRGRQAELSTRSWVPSPRRRWPPSGSQSLQCSSRWSLSFGVRRGGGVVWGQRQPLLLTSARRARRWCRLGETLGVSRRKKGGGQPYLKGLPTKGSSLSRSCRRRRATPGLGHWRTTQGATLDHRHTGGVLAEATRSCCWRWPAWPWGRKGSTAPGGALWTTEPRTRPPWKPGPRTRGTVGA